jgi:signal transduction histidine kinase
MIQEPINILLVDDQPAKLVSYAAILDELGENILTAGSAKEAFEHLLRNNVAVMLVDVRMPEVDGFELAAMVHEHPRFETTAIIFVSALALSDIDRLKGYEQGAVDYVPVPVMPELLRAKVRIFAELYRKTKQLRQLNAELTQRVAGTVAELEAALTQLSQAQKMEAVGQLSGGVAHSVNNLLQVILGNLGAVQRRLQRGEAVPPADLARRLDVSIRSGERGARLTQQLLAFARRQPLAPQQLDANKVVAGISDMLHLHRTLGETIEIKTVLAAGLWPILADPNQLESALLNLALNARDAMPKGGKLTIETANRYVDDDYASRHKEVRAGHYVLIAVSDTGTGMDKDVLDKAFEPFFTTKEVGQGTGLGLSQVYGFVKQSGGHVKIYSERGEGTTVKLYLPQDLTATAVADHPSDKTVPTGTPEEVILIVEDEAEVRANASEMLRELGYEVTEAPDGPTALRILESSPHVRLLFTDIGLPGGSTGRQLADEAIRLRPGLKVLFTTGYTRNAIVHRGRLDPDIEFLPKPFTFMELAIKVRRALDG